MKIIEAMTPNTLLNLNKFRTRTGTSTFHTLFNKYEISNALGAIELEKGNMS